MLDSAAPFTSELTAIKMCQDGIEQELGRCAFGSSGFLGGRTSRSRGQI
jgi:hypothetical protein